MEKLAGIAVSALPSTIKNVVGRILSFLSGALEFTEEHFWAAR